MKQVALQFLSGAMAEAHQLGARLGLSPDEIVIHRFPDGELRVTVPDPGLTTLLYAPLDCPNEKLLALLFASDALRNAGSRRLVLIAPYLCYMRQDTAFQPGEAISQKVVGRLLAACFDRVVTVDAHLHRTKRLEHVLPGCAADNLSAAGVIAHHLSASHLDPATILVGPDQESEPWVCDLAARLGLTFTVAAKVRTGDRAVEITVPSPPLVRGKPVLLVDDLVSTGSTLMACAKGLLQAGACSIDAVVTHALFPPAILPALTQAGIRSIRSTTSVRHPTNAFPLDGLLAASLADEVNVAGGRDGDQHHKRGASDA